MKKICFLLPEGVLKPTSLFSAIEVFQMANEYAQLKGHRPYYEISVVGNSLSQALSNSLLTIKTAEKEKQAKQDLIIIPALYEMGNYGTGNNQELIEWITHQYKNGSELASLCTGAFFLAATGLLRNMECATHWRAEESFRKMYPDVKLRVDKIITDSKGIYTAGGASSTLNLILYLVEKYNGREAAIYCAKMLQIDIERNTQSMFMLFEGQRNHDDIEIKQIQTFIEANIEEKISVESLAERFKISKRSLVRRFKKATNNPPIEYIQRVKIEGAKRDLEMKRKNVNEIMYGVGYTDIKAFRNIFKKITGLSPIEYRNKYNKDY